MASIQERGGRFQLRVVHKLLPKPFIDTYETRDAAENSGRQLQEMLDRGHVPQQLLERGAAPAKGDRTKVAEIVEDFITRSTPSRADIDTLKVVKGEVYDLRMSRLTYNWVEGYVRGLKTGANLAPGSIRKRVGALARVIDWHHRATTGRDQSNPLRLLPKGYSLYTDNDAAAAPAGARRDVQRDRRLSVEELEAVRLALSGVKRPDRERALTMDPAFALLFELILGTGLRLSEAYRLRHDQIDLAKGLLRVEGSKGHRGAAKPRNVPLRQALRLLMGDWLKGKGKAALAFPFWDGKPENLKKTSTRLSNRFADLFRYAGVEDFSEHDLRHSACCDWFEMRNAAGQWTFSDVEVCKIMGWSDYSMILRYASLRGEDLAARLG